MICEDVGLDANVEILHSVTDNALFQIISSNVIQMGC